MVRRRLLLPSVLSLCLLGTVLEESSYAADAPEKRALPNYDGRAPETSAGDVALWVPRIALAPLYLVSEFVVRRPLGALVSWAETSGAPKAFYDFFAFGPDHTAGFAPIGYIDFGFNPSVGAFVFWNDAGAKGHNLALHATTWGSEWLAGVFDERVRLSDQAALKFNFTAIHRPDLRFHGIGPDARDRDRTRYGQDLISMRLTLDARPAQDRANRVETFIGMRSTAFYNGHYEGAPGIVDAYRAKGELLPAGFTNGFTSVDTGARVALDTRRDVPGATRTGLRLDTEFVESSDLKRSPGSAWVTYGGTVGAFLDLHDSGRVLNAAVSVKFVDPLGNEPVPFTELIDGGGDGPLRGFAPGRLRGRSVASASLRYRWPIWVDVDGAISGSVGNVFGEHLEDFRPEKLRISTTLGIETVSSTGGGFQLLLGVGSDTFERGTYIDSVRFIIGTNRGF